MAGELYIGLMSGTSIDALDACMVEIFPDASMQVIAAHTVTWPPRLKALMHSLCSDGLHEMEKIGRAQNAMAALSSLAVTEVLKQAGMSADAITAIGSHGQTVRHRPEHHFSIQLDNGPMTALLTHIDTITNFRAQDLAAGGEGAPLTPLFHRLVLSSDYEPRLILNLGGIANLTAIKAGGELFGGWDCGPANTLMDLACRELVGVPFDKDGQIARRGRMDIEWLTSLMEHPFIKRRPPKSSGREDFGRECIAPLLAACQKDPARIPDLLATLVAFTATCVVNDIAWLRETCPDFDRDCTLVLCGGGAHNPSLVELLRAAGETLHIEVRTSAEFGIDENYLEAQAFAYFAWLTRHGRTADLRRTTGSSCPVVLGTICPAPDGRIMRLLRAQS